MTRKDSVQIHHLVRARTCRGTLQGVWDFFSNPRNLSRITPPALGFRILSEVPEQIYAGMLIEYRVRPLLGIPVTWLTEITQVAVRQFFVDEQRAGPYRLWHHEHHFADLGDGRVRVSDRVTYALPFGWLSAPVHRWVVKPQLERIFYFRDQALAAFFGDGPAREEVAVGQSQRGS